jgi:hypothetical protein
MKRFSLLILIFAILSLVFIILLVFLRIEFPLYPLVSYQDAFDILTPLVLIPVYWLLFKHSSSNESSLAEELAFMVLAAVWVEGQGIHLSANSIDNLSEALARSHVIDITTTDIYRLTYFFDEHVGHYMWHIGMVGLAAVLIYHEWRHPAELGTGWGAVTLAGFLYGFSYFCIFIEGQTVALGLPFAVIVLLFALIWGRKQLAQRPVLAFFFVTCLVAVLLFTVWGFYWHGFPQFTDVGLI